MGYFLCCFVPFRQSWVRTHHGLYVHLIFSLRFPKSFLGILRVSPAYPPPPWTAPPDENPTSWVVDSQEELVEEIMKPSNWLRDTSRSLRWDLIFLGPVQVVTKGGKKRHEHIGQLVQGKVAPSFLGRKRKNHGYEQVFQNGMKQGCTPANF